MGSAHFHHEARNFFTSIFTSLAFNHLLLLFSSSPIESLKSFTQSEKDAAADKKHNNSATTVLKMP